MWGDKEPTLREQLEEIDFRTHASFARRGGPPDFRSVRAELEAELREIDALLAAGDDGQP